MLCKNCKTSLEASAQACGYCGMKQPQNARLKLFFASTLSFLLLCLCAVYIYINVSGIYDAVETEVIISTEAPVPAQASPKPRDFSNEKLWETLAEIEKAASKYVNIHYTNSNFISKNGYLFSYEDNRFITVDDLIDDGALPREYYDEKALLFYLKPSDFRGFSEVDFGMSSGLYVFAGYETIDGIALVFDKYNDIAYRENFKKILSYYTPQSSQIKPVLAASGDYIKIMYALGLTGSEFTARHIRYDDNYAVVIISKENPEVLHGYILHREVGEFSPVLENFEEYGFHYIEKINSAAGDMNLELLPPTALDAVTLYGSDKYAYILLETKAKEYVVDEDFPLAYICGTDKFVYIEFQSGRKYLGLRSDNSESWELKPCSSRAAAKKMINDESLWMIVPE